MSVFEKGFYTINRSLLSLIGLWPYMDRRKTFLRTFFIQLGIICAIIIEVMRLIISGTDMDLMIENIMYVTSCTIVNIFYFGIFFRKRVDQIKLFESIKYEWRKVENQEEYEILRKFAAKTRNITIVILLIMYIHIGLTLPSSMYPLVLDVIDPLNKTRQMKFAPILKYFSGREKCILKIIFVYYLTMIAIGITIASTFGLLIVCVQHACSMFVLTGYVMRHSLEEQPGRLDDIYQENKAYARIIRAIECHKRALDFVDQINSLFAKSNFFTYTLWFITITFQISQINIIDEKLITLMIIQLFTIFVITFLGQKVIDYSNDVFKSVITTPWYLASVKVQKLFIIIMMNSIKPSYLSIGGLFVFTNEFFLISIKCSLSYAMVLCSFRQSKVFEEKGY